MKKLIACLFGLMVSISSAFADLDPCRNLFNPANVFNGYIQSVVGVNAITRNENSRTAYVAIQPNTKYTISKSNSNRLRVGLSHTVEGTFNAYTLFSDNETLDKITYTAENTDYEYLLVTVSSDGVVPADLQIEKGTTATSYVPYDSSCHNSGPISSVTVAGLVAQNGTPTPTTPVDIVSNNGVLKYGKPVTLDATRYYAYLAVGDTWSYSTDSYSIIVPVEVGKQYRITADPTTPIDDLANVILRWAFVDELPPDSWKVESSTAPTPSTIVAYDKVRTTPQETPSVIVTATRPYMIVQMGANIFASNIANGRISVAEHSLYTDGEVETIADSANPAHTATVATLLGVGDYRDTQNINTGAITRNVGVKVLDGSENWDKNQAANYYRIPQSAIGAATNVAMLCTHFNHGAINVVGNFNNGGAYINFHPDTDTASNTPEWKTWLATQYANGTPVIVIYPLATETTESVAGQTMTTAPVNNRTGGVTGMTITTLLSSGTSVVTTIATNAIKIATTAYNAARFNPVVTELNDTIATIRSVVTNTINQTKAIADLQATKQTRPDETCPAGKKCLLVEDNDGQPHWYEIIEKYSLLPDGYTELQYIESTGTQYIDTGVTGNARWVITAQTNAIKGSSQSLIYSTPSASGGTWYGEFTNTGHWDIVSGGTNIPPTTKTTADLTFDGNGARGTIGSTSVNRSVTVTQGNWRIFGNSISVGLFAGKLFDAKVYQNGTLVRDFVPAKRNSDDVIGMYDLANPNPATAFYRNSGSGTFVAGPEI